MVGLSGFEPLNSALSGRAKVPVGGPLRVRRRRAPCQGEECITAFDTDGLKVLGLLCVIHAIDDLTESPPGSTDVFLGLRIGQALRLRSAMKAPRPMWKMRACSAWGKSLC